MRFGKYCGVRIKIPEGVVTFGKSQVHRSWIIVTKASKGILWYGEVNIITFNYLENNYFGSCDCHIAVGEDRQVTGGTLGQTHDMDIIAHGTHGTGQRPQVLGAIKITEAGIDEVTHLDLNIIGNLE